MTIIGLSTAHNEKSVGASYKGFSEHYESIVWTKLLKDYLEKLGYIVVYTERSYLSDKVAYLKQENVSIALEIHFNGSKNPTVNGCETLYYPKSILGKRLASSVHGSLSKVMGNKNRGIKEGWYKMDKAKGINYFLANTTCPAIIIEPEFVSQIKNITKKRVEGTIAIAEGIQRYLNE